MDADEREIYNFLKTRRHEFISVRDISQRLGSKRLRNASPEWAKSILERMTERGILQTDGEGFCLKPIQLKENSGKRWVSPEVAKILKASGKFSDRVLDPGDEDEYYNKL
ncbi:hypothetical protein SBV1_1910018 [Verrucomicrobia bacterium]|nr:hypothetical protein SBV1_1910018 [Verrucomicrobiota bacterium]